jgi:small subunit ribosomal protein S2
LVRAIAFEGGQILFIGTRPDLRTIVKSAAGRIGKQGYYVSDRWIPGTLTNAPELFGQAVANEVEARPDLVVLLNPLSNITCIRECALAHIPTIGIIDSDADPRIVMYPIPANDESPQTAEIVAGILSIAGREGLALRMEDDVREEEMVQNEIDDNFWDELEKEQQAEAEENDGSLAELQYQAEHGEGFEEFQDPENSDDEERPRGQHFDY